jgi:hypothetical protein
VKWTLISLGVATLMSSACSIGVFKGTAMSGTKLGPLLAKAIYEHLRHGQLDEVERSGACTSNCLSQLRDFERDHGRVEAYEIQGVRTGVFGIPVMVEMRVRRRGRAYSEVLIMNTRNCFDTASAGGGASPGHSGL